MGQLASGHLAVRALKQAGVEHLFTLSGGHIFPLYDGCRHEGVRLVDFRHEQAATFAAEGLGKLTRRPQVAALTAGPGVTNGMSAVASARFGGSPLLVLGGRAPAATWGSGSLQEIDHVAFMAPVTKYAQTADVADKVAAVTLEALRAAGTPRRGPAFVDVPMDVIFSPAEEESVPAAALGRGGRARPGPARRPRGAPARRGARRCSSPAPTCGSARRRTSCAPSSSCCRRRWSSTAWAGDCCPPTTRR